MTLIAEHIEGDIRDRILEVAERLFRQIGYQKTTFGDIARSCAERYPQGAKPKDSLNRAQVRRTAARPSEASTNSYGRQGRDSETSSAAGKVTVRHRGKGFRLESGSDSSPMPRGGPLLCFVRPYHQRLQAPRNRPRLTAESAG
jgi:hypothetical protein